MDLPQPTGSPTPGVADPSPYQSPLRTPAEGAYRTEPEPTSGMPSGIPFIVGNEAAERFSYYGMRAILVVFMTQYLLGANGQPEPMVREEAMVHYHRFLSFVYLFPLLGSVIADAVLGKYRTIIALSLVYCAGHVALSTDETRFGLGVGLALIALGSGGIKPCVSANVGDQFGSRNRHLVEQVFGWFYLAINVGAAVSSAITPYLLKHYGSRVAFALPGVLMFVATFVFWAGRRKYVHAPPAGLGVLREALSRDGLKVLGKLAIVYTFVSFFWCLYDQTSSAWILQAQDMDLNLFGWKPEPAQTHVLNPVLILLFVPLFTYVIYPVAGRFFELTALRKIGIGFFLTAGAFAISAMIQQWIDAGQRPHFVWQSLAYLVMTGAEVMVSVTGLAYSYQQAPASMKSVVMAFWSLTVAAGNQMTSVVNQFAVDAEGNSQLPGASYYWFFTGLMLASSVLFVPTSRLLRAKQHPQAG